MKNIYHTAAAARLRATAPLLKSALIVMMTLGILYGCDDFVGVDLPDTQLNTPNVFEEKATANAAMTDVFARIRDYGLLSGNAQGLSFTLGLYTDELDYYATPDQGNTLFYNNALLATTPEVRTLFNTTYGQIYAANAIVEGIDNSVRLPQSDRDRLKGEALFVRALLHFHLAGIFGPVPYIKTTDYVQNSRTSKSAVIEVYALCVSDLQESISLLPVEYVSATRTRPNQMAARALLTRLALMMGDYMSAENQASAVINETALYANVTDLSQTFLKESTATIWQLSPGSGFNTLEALTFIFEQGPPPSVALTQDLVDAFPVGDLRKQNWTREISDGVNTWSHAYKYKATTGEAVENSIVLRLPEMYLIRAEARARLGELTTAKEDLNVVRSLAGIGQTLGTSQAEILADILLQDRLEFFTEMGRRFFDLKRFGLLDQVLPATKPNWGTNDALLPIPQEELLLNPNLQPQNPGY